MKSLVIAGTVALLLGSAAQAAVVDIAAGHVATHAAPQQASRALVPGDLSAHDLQVLRRVEVIAPVDGAAELPDPEVFLMMLVGLGLLGYRASRRSDEPAS